MVDREPSQHTRRTFVRNLALTGGGASVLGAASPAAQPSPPLFRLYHEEHGDGPALIFAHGAGGTHMSWWNQIPTFSREFRCITYSQRGFGFSPDVPGGPGRGAFVEDLRRLLDDLSIERASLIGQSMGGRSVLGFAAAHPERVETLVMSSTTGGYRDAELDALGASAPDLGPRSPFALAYEERDPEGAFLYRLISRTNRRLSAEDAAPTEARIPDIRRVVEAGIPTLFVVGELDTVVAPSVLRGMQAKMPGSTLVTFDDSGHSPYWEIPERFNRVVLDFLRG